MGYHHQNDVLGLFTVYRSLTNVVLLGGIKNKNGQLFEPGSNLVVKPSADMFNEHSTGGKKRKRKNPPH